MPSLNLKKKFAHFLLYLIFEFQFRNSFIISLIVENRIDTHLPTTKTCLEDEKCIFNLTVTDKNAYVTWTINGFNLPIIPGNRTETIHDHSHGNHALIIKQAKITDNWIVATTPTNRGDGMIMSESNLTVIPPEYPPVIGNLLSVNCSVKNGCEIIIPYQHVGTKKSQLVLECVYDRKNLVINESFHLTTHDDRFELSFNHPKYEKSGPYRFTLSNDKGWDAATVQVNIIDSPSVTRNLTVKSGSLTHDSLVLTWLAPLFMHGSNIKKYIIEVRTSMHYFSCSQICQVI